MKKFVLFIVVIALIAQSCKKDEETPSTPAPTAYQITSSDIGGAGDEFKIVQYTLLPADTFTVGATGQTLVWVYNPIPISTEVDTVTFTLPSAHPDGAFFTGSNLCLNNHETDEMYMFLDKQSDKVDITGIWVAINGDTLKGNLSDRYTVLKFPMTYGASYSDSGFVSILTEMDYQGQMVPAKYEITFKINSSCNAEGNITTPLGTFKCVREKRTEINLFNVKIQMYSQWIEAYNQADTSYHYSFWTKEKKWNVAELDVDITDKIITLGHLTEL